MDDRYRPHLRPKNKQSQQYIRMASDIVRDLELDQPPRPSDDDPDDDGDDDDITAVSEERLAGMRAYMSSYYLASAYVGVIFSAQSTDQLPPCTTVPFQRSCRI